MYGGYTSASILRRHDIPQKFRKLGYPWLKAGFTGLSLSVREGEHARLMYKEFLLPGKCLDLTWPQRGTQGELLHSKSILSRLEG